MQTITPFLWFDGRAEEAARFYTSVFRNAKILSVMPGQGGKASGVTFQLLDREFIAFNGGPAHATFNESVSFFVPCETQAEVDDLWEKLSAGGQKGRCGWLKDRFGLSWQIVPTVLPRLLGDPDRIKANRVMQAMLEMNKLDIAGLQRAYDLQ